MRRDYLNQGLLLLALFPALYAKAEQAPVKAEDLLPENTLAALWIPDLSAARAAASKSRMAEMFAQPEMQAFLQPAQAEIQKVYEELKAQNPLLPALKDLDQGLFSGEIAVGIYARTGDTISPVGVLVTMNPKDPEAFKRLLPAEIGRALFSGEPVPLGVLPTDPAMVFSGGRLLFCAPQGDLKTVMLRHQDPALRAKETLAASKDFMAVRGKLSASTAQLYLAPKRVMDLAFSFAMAMGDREAPKIQVAVKALGLDRISAFGIGTGFSGAEPVLESCLIVSEQPSEGLLGLFYNTAAPSEAAFKIAAPNAPYVSVGYFNLAGILPLARKTIEAVRPKLVAQVDMALGLLNAFLGFDLQKDLLENLGGEMITAQTEIDTGAPLSFFPGLACSLPAKNGAKVEECLRKLGPALAAAPMGAAGALRMKSIEHRGKAIHYISGKVFAGPAAFAVVGDRLLVGTSVNALRRTIEQLEQPKSILDQKSFQDVVARLSGKPFDAKALPSSFSYAIDNGTGAGSLVLAGMWLLTETAGVAGVAEIPKELGKMAGGPAAANSNRQMANEAAAMAACKVYAEAQDIYRRSDWDGDGILEYAQSLKGNHSLFEKKEGTGDLSLIDQAFAAAEGNPGAKEQKAGYRFKVLKGQGAAAPGGKKSYLVPGDGASANMTLGYGLVAYPAQYGITGRTTYQINNTGVVFGKDLGEKTADLVTAMDAYAPDATWKTEDAEEMEGGGAAPPIPTPNPLDAFTSRPSAKVALRIAGAIDLSLWPDEGFFAAYRRATGSIAQFGATGVTWRSELPMPGPAISGAGISPLMMTATVATVAAIAIPNLLRSRMAANESAAIAACKCYAEAQEIYRRTDWDADGILEYAQSLKGDHSLYEKTAGMGDLSLIDAAFANAEGKPGVVTPKAGYVFKVLKGQGPNAPGGKKSYVANGNMTLGYAFIACPAKWDGTGRNTFLINNTGTVYQKDMGAETEKLVEQITEYNPDQSWVVSE